MGSAAVIIGTSLVELLKAYAVLKQQQDASTLADAQRIAALDKIIAGLTSDMDVADAEANADLGLPPPAGE